MQTAQTLSLDPNAIEESLRLATPAWPLQNAVAVNPFWNLREGEFYRVLSELSPVLHATLFMPLRYYVHQYRTGAVNARALSESLAQARELWPGLPAAPDDFLEASEGAERTQRNYPSFAEDLGPDGYWKRVVVNEIGRYAAAYFDGSQALAPFPWRGGSFWEGWREALRYDKSMDHFGAGEFRRLLEPLEGQTPEEAIAGMLDRMKIHAPAGQKVYLQRLMASVLGWASQFSYHAWQTGRGYETDRTSPLTELLAVRLAYDYGLYAHATRGGANRKTTFWQTAYNEITEDGPERRNDHRLHYVWLTAFERSYQQRVASQLKLTPAPEGEAPEIQMAFCIDVRSEMIRRRLEEENANLETVGFAGFFGMPFDYRRLDEKRSGQRLPVLLPPAMEVNEAPRGRGTASGKVAESYVRSFFRNLRKNTFSSFLYVEVFGILSVENVIRSTFLSLMRRLRGRRIPARFDDGDTRPDQLAPLLKDGSSPDVAARAERMAGILKGMGIHERMARLVLLVGHGSETVNNAFGSALDCGACGGHSGDINARVVADTLNEPEIRAHLGTIGIAVPETTWFAAAVHETVTDNIFILDESTIPGSHGAVLYSLLGTMRRASARTRRERQGVLSEVVDRHVERRTRNWAEVRPEWGLTGNAAFLVAPRHRSRGVNLASRTFLHDYDWTRDEGFGVLETIMTAPMVVTNWINMQYYASTVATEVYSSGNKLLHNLVNETGVVEGNGGDLRVGLTFQSIHDGERFAHEPLRLSVFIEAPRDAVETIIAKHQVVRELVDNGWLRLLLIDPENATILTREQGGRYVPLTIERIAA